MKKKDKDLIEFIILDLTAPFRFNVKVSIIKSFNQTDKEYEERKGWKLKFEKELYFDEKVEYSYKTDFESENIYTVINDFHNALKEIKEYYSKNKNKKFDLNIKSDNKLYDVEYAYFKIDRIFRNNKNDNLYEQKLVCEFGSDLKCYTKSNADGIFIAVFNADKKGGKYSNKMSMTAFTSLALTNFEIYKKELYWEDISDYKDYNDKRVFLYTNNIDGTSIAINHLIPRNKERKSKLAFNWSSKSRELVKTLDIPRTIICEYNDINFDNLIKRFIEIYDASVKERFEENKHLVININSEIRDLGKFYINFENKDGKRINENVNLTLIEKINFKSIILNRSFVSDDGVMCNNYKSDIITSKIDLFGNIIESYNINKKFISEIEDILSKYKFKE